MGGSVMGWIVASTLYVLGAVMFVCIVVLDEGTRDVPRWVIVLTTVFWPWIVPLGIIKAASVPPRTESPNKIRVAADASGLGRGAPSGTGGFSRCPVCRRWAEHKEDCPASGIVPLLHGDLAPRDYTA